MPVSDTTAPYAAAVHAPEVRLLRSFLAVVQHRSISAAARRLYLTQQTLSGQIRQLERTMGVPLLVRGARGVTLTAAGERLAVGAAQVTEHLEALVAEVRHGAPLHDPYAGVESAAGG